MFYSAPGIRRGLLLPLLLIAAALVSGSAAGQDEVTIGTSRHGISLVDLALPKLLNPGADPALGQVIEELREVIWSDLDFSGLFQMVDKRFYGYIPPYNLQRPVYEDWEGIGAQAFLLGSLRLAGREQGRTIYSADIILYDVKSRQRMLGKKYDSSRPLLLAHTIADEIIRHYTGTAGIGSSKIAFISDRDGNKELYVMDWDGRRQVRLTANRSLDLSPSWEPDGKRIAYVCTNAAARRSLSWMPMPVRRSSSPAAAGLPSSLRNGRRTGGASSSTPASTGRASSTSAPGPVKRCGV